LRWCALRPPLITLGFFQYLALSVTLLVAALYYGDPIQAHQRITFGLIWAALVVFSIDELKRK
jgi:chloramphenicol-sensitive protein RarD|tara:strand:+ start:746 stop:934 length:189 start_codon:yes stop_codon:yes gene_type:complete